MSLKLPTSQEHWSARFLGRQFVAGEYDCADFIVDVQRDHFGKIIKLPQHATSIRSRDSQIVAVRETMAQRTTTPIEGDAVLMKMKGRASGIGHHVGLYVPIGGRAHVLHCYAGIGSSLHRLSALSTIQLELDGFYRWA